MNIFLLILKIIGIVILCILGILLAGILLVLFVPFRYRLDGKKEDKLEGRARVTWLLHFIVAEVSYVSKLNIRIKILGIPFYDRLRKKAKEEKKAAREEEEEESFEEEEENDSSEEQENTSESSETEELKEESSTETSDEDMPAEEGPAEAEAPEATEKEEQPSGEKEKEPEKVKKSFGQKLDDMADALEDGLDEFEDMLDDTADDLEAGMDKLRTKIESIADTIGYYRRILESDGALWVFDYVVKHVKACLKNVRPRRIDADIRFSNDDPATVAEVWKIYAIAVTLIGNIRGKRELDTKLDESEIRFSAGIRGRATAAVLAYHGLCLLFNKKVRKFIKLMKREDKADGGK